MIDGWAGRGGCSTLAHRGGAALGPANSLVAVQRSVAAGAHAMELDLQELADGSLVLHHDSSVLDGDTRVRLADLELDELQRILPVAPPTLTSTVEALVRLGCGLYLDVKRVSYAGLLRAIEVVSASPLRDRTVVGSFDRAVAAQVVADGRLRASVLYRDVDLDPLQLQRTIGCSVVHPCFDDQPWMVDALAGAWMDRVHAAGLRVVGWNTNEPTVLGAMRAAGFDALCTDDPRVA